MERGGDLLVSKIVIKNHWNNKNLLIGYVFVSKNCGVGYVNWFK